jgi:hypothetical protein
VRADYNVKIAVVEAMAISVCLKAALMAVVRQRCSALASVLSALPRSSVPLSRPRARCLR